MGFMRGGKSISDIKLEGQNIHPHKAGHDIMGKTVRDWLELVQLHSMSHM